MPEYFSQILLLFVLASCFYKKHILDWWWFHFGLLAYVASMILPAVSTMIGNTFSPTRAITYYAGQVALIGAFTCFLIACFKRARTRVSVLRCLKCNYILKGLSEPRCPECGWRI